MSQVIRTHFIAPKKLIEEVDRLVGPRRRSEFVTEATVALCAITVAELYSGLNEKKRAKWENWLLALPYWHISPAAAMQAGTYRKTASDAGRTLSVTDSLIAALTSENGATVLTINIKDYPMKGVIARALRDKAA